MPSPSGSTPIYGFPYLLETDQPDVATASEDLALAVEAEAQLVVPIGFVGDWYSNTPPAQMVGGKPVWLFLHGQTVTGGATDYPLLAAVYPSWVSGSNLVLPNTEDKFTIGAGGAHAPGSTGGSATTTLTTAHIPRFSSVALSISDPGHSHISASPASGFVVDFEPTTLFSNSGSLGDHSPAANLTIQSNTAVATTGVSGTVTFGNTSPTGVAITPPFIAAHKIVRAK